MSSPTNTGERQPLVASAVGNAQPRDFSYISSNRKYRIGCLAVSLLCTIMWVAMLSTRHMAPMTKGYHTRTSCLDVAIVEFAATLAFIVAVLFATSYGTITAVRYLSWWLLMAAITKLWLYKGWGDKSSMYDTIGFVVTLVALLARVVMVSRIIDVVPSTGLTSTDTRAEKPAEGGHRLKWASLRKILKPYVVPQRFRNRIFVVLTYVCLGIGKACEMVAPLVLGQIVSRISANPPESAYNLLFWYAALSIAPTLFSEAQDVLYVKVGQTAFKEVAETTFRHVHALSLDWHLKKKMGNVMRSIDRGQQAADNLMYYGVVFLMPAIGTAIATFILFAVHFQQDQIAALCFLGFGTYAWVTYVVTIWRRKFRQGMNKSDNAMHDKSSDSLINFETVKYFSNEDYEIKEYIQLVREYQAGGYKAQASVSLLNVSQNTAIQLSMLGTLSVAAYCIVNHEDGFDVGEFVAVQAYVLTIFSPLTRLGSIYNVIINSLVDLQNLSDLLASQPDVVDRPKALDFAVANAQQQGATTKKGVTIEFKNVRFRYPTQPEAAGVHDVSFTVAAGTTTAIVGETGSGKTTLSRLLFRFYDILGGDILLNGISIKDITQKSLRQAIGIVPQDTVMFNDTVTYNIKYGKLDATPQEVEEAARKAQVHRFIDNLEKKYDTVVGERGLKLSGGEKQRLAVARCLLKDPPIVLLDEATSALDNKTERELQKALRCLAGRTTLVIAHRLTTIKHAEQIIVMRGGRIVERGTHDELLAMGASGYYYSMWNAQLVEEETKAKVEGTADGGDVDDNYSDASALASPTVTDVQFPPTQ